MVYSIIQITKKDNSVIALQHRKFKGTTTKVQWQCLKAWHYKSSQHKISRLKQHKRKSAFHECPLLFHVNSDELPDLRNFLLCDDDWVSKRNFSGEWKDRMLLILVYFSLQIKGGWLIRSEARVLNDRDIMCLIRVLCVADSKKSHAIWSPGRQLWPRHVPVGFTLTSVGFT